MSQNFKKCQNCGAENHTQAKFCNNCGQKFEDKLNFKALFYNTISNYFSFDARFLKSIIPLLFKPGYIAKEFVNGRRLLYLHPGQMYLFVTVIFFFVFNFYVREGRESLDKTSQLMLKEKESNFSTLDSILKVDSLDVAAKREIEKIADQYDIRELKNLDSLEAASNSNNKVNFDFDENIVDSLIVVGASEDKIYRAMGMSEDAGYIERRFYQQGLKFYKNMEMGQVYQYFIDSIPLAMFVLMPFFALILKLLYFKRGNYSHHLVFGLYYFCFLFTILSIFLGINLMFEEFPKQLSWSIIIISSFLYLWIGIVKFYQKGWFLSFVKTSIISFTYLLFVIPLAFAVLIVIAFFFY